jgi:hypothetical protein
MATVPHPVQLRSEADRRRVRHGDVAYEVTTRNGSLVLCPGHLRQFRHKATFTGRTFSTRLCDLCYPEES